jgi:hypothetical protein
MNYILQENMNLKIYILLSYNPLHDLCNMILIDELNNGMAHMVH